MHDIQNIFQPVDCVWSHTKQKKRGIGHSSWRLPYEWVNRRLPLTVLHDSFAVHQGPFGPTCQTSFSLQVQDYSTARRCCQLKRGWQRRKKRCFWSKSGEFDANINTFSKQNGESMKTNPFLPRKNSVNPLPRNDFLKFPTNRLSPLFLFFLPHFVVTKWNCKIPKLPQFFRLSNRSILVEKAQTNTMVVCCLPVYASNKQLMTNHLQIARLIFIFFPSKTACAQTIHPNYDANS